VRITGLQTFVIEVPVRRQVMITSSLGTHERSRFTLVRLETDTGVEGAGEAAVSPRWSGETAVGAQHVIDEHLAPAVLGRDPRDIEGILQALEGAAFGNPFAKAAMEMAAWDAAGKAAGQPVYALLGGPARDLALPIRFSLAAGSPSQTAERARERVAWGHRTIKVKVGLDPGPDVERVRAVREAIGPEVQLTVDANGGWSVEESIWALREMRDLDLLLAEQPTPREDLEAMARVRASVEVPIMADESVFTMYEARRALRLEAADIVAVYPGKNGGIEPARRIAATCGEAGVPCAIGSNLELDVGTAAMCHLAVAAPNVDAERYHGDILGPLYHEASIARAPVRIERGYAHCPTGPGLGVEVDWDIVGRLQLRR
jgi:L-alanine-DL-glutamate epimerase-like enolase superfamily enzyme